MSWLGISLLVLLWLTASALAAVMGSPFAGMFACKRPHKDEPTWQPPVPDELRIWLAMQMRNMTEAEQSKLWSYGQLANSEEAKAWNARGEAELAARRRKARKAVAK